MIIVVSGGSGSGKSAIGETIAMTLDRCEKYYIATMEPYGSEAHARIAKHRAMRAEKNFVTLECQRHLESIVLPMLEGDRGSADVTAKLQGQDRNGILEATKVPEQRKKRACEATAMLECISNLTSNEMFSQDTSEKEGMEEEQMLLYSSGEETARRIIAGIRRLGKLCKHVIIITNEVFSDGIQYDPMCVEYIKCIGLVNQELMRMADVFIESVCGIPVFRKGELELS